MRVDQNAFGKHSGVSKRWAIKGSARLHVCAPRASVRGDFTFLAKHNALG